MTSTDALGVARADPVGTQVAALNESPNSIVRSAPRPRRRRKGEAGENEQEGEHEDNSRARLPQVPASRRSHASFIRDRLDHVKAGGAARGQDAAISPRTMPASATPNIAATGGW